MNGTMSRLLALSPATLGILSKLSSLQIQRISADTGTGLFQDMLPPLERFRYDIYIGELKKTLPQANHVTLRLREVEKQSFV
jgi:hypothetical protein